MEQHIIYLLEHFGYLGIVFALIGGIAGLPIPDEILLTFVGYNVYQGNLLLLPSILSAFIGATGGITLSYFIGLKFGLPLLEKYGPRMHITEKKIDQTRKLFDKLGPILLFIGYFIPGVRHLVAYIAAINNFPFKKFALFTYCGAFFWSFTFITLGRRLGKNWGNVEMYLSKYSIYLMILILVLSIFVYFIGKKKGQLANSR